MRSLLPQRCGGEPFPSCEFL